MRELHAMYTSVDWHSLGSIFRLSLKRKYRQFDILPLDAPDFVSLKISGSVNCEIVGKMTLSFKWLVLRWNIQCPL